MSSAKEYYAWRARLGGIKLKEYALYKHGSLVTVGNIKELSKSSGLKVATLCTYVSRPRGGWEVIELEEDSDDEII